MASEKTTTKEVKKSTPKSEDFAVIESGGKQYIVAVGDILDVELLNEYHKEGDVIEFDKVLMTDDGKNAKVGTPYVDGAKVKAVYQTMRKGKKLSIVRFMAKSNRDRKIGHRQKYSRVKISSV